MEQTLLLINESGKRSYIKSSQFFILSLELHAPISPIALNQNEREEESY